MLTRYHLVLTKVGIQNFRNYVGCIIVSCTVAVGIVGLRFIVTVMASFCLLPLETIGLVDYLQNIVNICLIFLTALVTYKVIPINEPDSKKFLKFLNRAYKRSNKTLCNYCTIEIETQLQFDKFTKKKCGNDWMAVMEVESWKCIVEDPREASEAYVTIVSAKLCTSNFSQNDNTFKT